MQIGLLTNNPALLENSGSSDRSADCVFCHPKGLAQSTKMG
jgi:hypothetical protein